MLMVLPGDRCGILSVENGNVSCTQTSPDEESCVITCNHGYSLGHNTTRANPFNCTKSIGWEGGRPYCQAIDCGSFLLPRRSLSSVICSGTKLSDTCSVSCPLGYVVDDNFVSVCQDNGVWSDVNSSCTLVVCPHPVRQSFCLAC